MRITADRRDEIVTDFKRHKIKCAFQPDNGTPRMYCSKTTRTVVFNLHAINNHYELNKLIRQAKAEMGIK